MEYIGTYNDISYYNDTIATIPAATINAVGAIKNVDTLIFGGMDRGIDYNEFIKFLEESNISNLVCMPTTGTNLGKILEEKTNKNIYFVNTLEEAYDVASSKTKKGYSVLLSPAAASYEFFKNFEEKGRAFEEIVKNNNK
jgi:UDP-N-acetylmuramoylalanine--D-glutamate ligase